jgi:hypothetical protein
VEQPADVSAVKEQNIEKSLPEEESKNAYAVTRGMYRWNS